MLHNEHEIVNQTHNFSWINIFCKTWRQINPLLEAVFFYRQCVKDLATSQTHKKKSHKVLYGSYDVIL